MKKMEIWDIWYPKAGPTGIPFARGRLDATNKLLIHACPPFITVEVRNDNGKLLAKGVDLKRSGESPLILLQKTGKKITLRDFWPSKKEEGLPVILPGGEVGIIKKWWYAKDKSEWKWECEFYNHI
ncbi:hypothetical protein HYW55_01050 [Candidatus Gottesmanbacteria bacterium]|nr:hypothetical protein [Candidatus Gottesmanbacteria bacterium]